MPDPTEFEQMYDDTSRQESGDKKWHRIALAIEAQEDLRVMLFNDYKKGSITKEVWWSRTEKINEKISALWDEKLAMISGS